MSEPATTAAGAVPTDDPAPTLAGRVVLVTGAGQGVGQGIAQAAAAAGASVAVTARRRGSAQAVVDEIAARGGQAHAVVCDVTRADSVDAAVAATAERFGRLDGVVHNATSAGSSVPTPLWEVTDEDWDDQVGVALRGAYHLARASRDLLEASQGAYLVLVSTAGVEGSTPLPTYSAVKAAQRALVKSLAREWGPRGIRVNALAPVAVSRAMADFLEREPEARERLSERAALRRLGETEADIGRAATFLLGPDSAFVTGQMLVVNGGAFLY